MFFIISQDYTLIVTKPYENKEMFLTTLNEQRHRPYRTMETKERSAHSVGLLCDVISRDRCQIENFKTLVYCEKTNEQKNNSPRVPKTSIVCMTNLKKKNFDQAGLDLTEKRAR